MHKKIDSRFPSFYSSYQVKSPSRMEHAWLFLHHWESSSALGEFMRTGKNSLRWGQGAPFLWTHSDLYAIGGPPGRKWKILLTKCTGPAAFLSSCILVLPPGSLTNTQPPCRVDTDFPWKLFKWAWLVSRANAVPKPHTEEPQVKKVMQIGPLASSNENVPVRTFQLHKYLKMVFQKLTWEKIIHHLNNQMGGDP